MGSEADILIHFPDKWDQKGAISWTNADNQSASVSVGLVCMIFGGTTSVGVGVCASVSVGNVSADSSHWSHSSSTSLPRILLSSGGPAKQC